MLNLKIIFLVFFYAACSKNQNNSPSFTQPLPEGSLSLFNEINLENWDTYLGPPNGKESPIGLNTDPDKIFSVVEQEGVPAIRIAGKNWGALVTKVEYQNFWLQFQYKWGGQVFPPLNFRDSGLMYFSTGEFGMVNAGGNSLSSPAGSGSFMVSLEYQMVPKNIGDLVNLGPISFSKSIFTAVDEVDGWNYGEIKVKDNFTEHFLNGVKVMEGSAL